MIALIAKTNEGDYYMLTGRVAVPPKTSVVGEKKKEKTTIAVSAIRDGNLCNVVAWNELSPVAGKAKKWDRVFVVAKKKESEYKGKKYTDYEAEFISIAGGNDSKPVASGSFTLGEFTDISPEELPF